MSDFKTEYPVLYFNEYFRRNPMRLNERESEELFTLEETDVNNFEYISLHDHEKEIASLKEQLSRQQEQHERAMILIGVELAKEQDNSDEMKELIIQATPYVEYAVKYSTPLSQKRSEEWLEKTQARIEK